MDKTLEALVSELRESITDYGEHGESMRNEVLADLLKQTDRIAAALAAREKCSACNGRGEVGGWRPGDGYDAVPCPDCATPARQAAEGGESPCPYVVTGREGTSYCRLNGPPPSAAEFFGIKVVENKALAPDEFVLVPTDPTPEMIEAGILFGTSPNKACIIYQSMVNARPSGGGEVGNG